MSSPVSRFTEILTSPAVIETFVDIILCAVPIWAAVMIGLLIGWSWRPRWTGLVFIGIRSRVRFAWTIPPGFGARRVCILFTALSALSAVGRKVWETWMKGKGKGEKETVGGNGEQINSSSSGTSPIEGVVTENDLEHLLNLLEGKGGEMGWQSLMERSTSNMAYQAWRHDPEFVAYLKFWDMKGELTRVGATMTGPVVYRSKTVFEDATSEMVRDFFWDDESRPKWDPMLAHMKILEECPRTGMLIVHWIKKFPFFCSDREYIIGRRIWEAGKTFYCVTKGVPYPALQKRDKPRRVDLYFSSWVIKPVQSRKGDGQIPACEVTLVHYEDMGIPKDVAKLGVRHGMWGTVKKLHSGFRAYQQARKSDDSLSRCALMARITTKISPQVSTDHLQTVPVEEDECQNVNIQRGNGDGSFGCGIDWKLVVLGGAVAVVCGLHTGMIGKGLLIGAGRRLIQR